jgi:hypothetical protein
MSNPIFFYVLGLGFICTYFLIKTVESEIVKEKSTKRGFRLTSGDVLAIMIVLIVLVSVV